MTYPNFKNKHLQESLFHPTDFIKYKKFKGKFPKKYILTYQESAKKYFLRRYNPKKIKLSSLPNIYVYMGVGFVKINGIGASGTGTTLEELIALGGKKFLNIGTAGGLHHEGIFLCNKALRDEGTSYHYIKHGKFSFPNKAFTKEYGKYIKKQKLKFYEGATWTIDAPYRETKVEIEKYAKKGIATVEMEASALFAIARYRKIKIASVFVVSDILKEKWEPRFHKINIKHAQNKLIDAAVNCLKN